MNELLLQDIQATADLSLPWEKLQNKSILVAGASGLVGSFLIQTLAYQNMKKGLNCQIYALVRDQKKAEEKFQNVKDERFFHLVCHDLNEPFAKEIGFSADYILHLASNTHPRAYALDPIGTITTNVFGTKNLLDFAVNCRATRFLFASSNEIYGENRGDTETFDERYCGYIDCNTLRAGYPEGKRCGEALCQAYLKQKELNVVVARLTRSYGSTMLMTDSKALSQFLKNALNGEDIILKSEGKQYYSYTYVADAVSGLLTVLLKGETGQAYNIADEAGDVTLRDLAGYIASFAGKEVIFDLPDATEQAGFSVVTKARLKGEKLKKLGWQMRYPIKEGIFRTLTILSQE